jgi:hypothetical protein
MQNENLSRLLPTVRDATDRFRSFRADTQEMWARARRAVVDAQRIRIMVKAQVQELGNNEGFRIRYQNAMLGKILGSAIAETSADMGNIQLLDHDSGILKIRAHRGFEAPFLDYFNDVESGQAACGTAMKAGVRVIVEDTVNSAIFRNSPSLEVLLDANVRAVQSTPIIGENDDVIGILSTHYRKPTRPSTQDLQVLDYYAREIAALMEWRDELGYDALRGRSRIFLFRPERAKFSPRLNF